MSELADKRCVPCEGGASPLDRTRINELLTRVSGWHIEHEFRLTKVLKFPDFVTALAFVNKIGAIAEEQSHHPDLHLAWGTVRVEIWTHKINGLTESDFILAARIDAAC